MSVEWRESTWGDVISLEYGKALRGYDTPSGKFRVFGSNGPIGWTTQPLASGPGVILGRKGATRGVEFSREPFFVIDTAYYAVPKTELDMRWLFYAIKHHKLGEIDDGSPIPSTTRSAVYVRDLRVPPIAEQKSIATVLGPLDDKIELNRQMNETLEALTQTLFKNWFMDAAATKLPNGWREGTLGEVAENPRRGIQPDEIKSSTPYIGLEHMPRRSIALSEWESDTKLGSNKLEFKRGEILFGKLRPYFHKVGVAPLGGVCSTDILVVRPKTPEWFGFVLGHVSSVELVNHTNAASTGTKMPRTNWNDLARFEVALPPESLAAEFTATIRPMIDRIIANIHESRTLAALRDALLPKLLSGELRVPVAHTKEAAI
jgi:type I restriction enzyme S subunit